MRGGYGTLPQKRKPLRASPRQEARHAARPKPRTPPARSGDDDRSHHHPELWGLGMVAVGALPGDAALARLGRRRSRGEDRRLAARCLRRRGVRDPARPSRPRRADAGAQQDRRSEAVPHGSRRSARSASCSRSDATRVARSAAVSRVGSRTSSVRRACSSSASRSSSPARCCSRVARPAQCSAPPAAPCAARVGLRGDRSTASRCPTSAARTTWMTTSRPNGASRSSTRPRATPT